MLVYQIALQLMIEEHINGTAGRCGRERHIRRDDNNEEAILDWKSFNQRMSRDYYDSSIAFFAYQEIGEITHLTAISCRQPLTKGVAEDELKHAIYKIGNHVCLCKVTDFRESTLAECCNALLQGEENGMIRGGFRFYADIGLTNIKEQLEMIRRKDGYRLEEYIAVADCPHKRDAMSLVRKIMGHPSIKEEMTRIYHNDNHKCFLEHPVHYVIRASSRLAAQEIIDVLVGGLFANGRLLSRRINYFCDFDRASGKERSIRGLVDSAKYATVAVELPNIKSCAMRPLRLGATEMDMPRFWIDETAKHHRHTLFIFVEIFEDECDWIKDFESDLSNIVDVIPLCEGSGNEKTAWDYLNHLATVKGLPVFEDDDLKIAVSKGLYRPTHVIEIFHRLCKMRLHRDFYPAYQYINAYNEKNIKCAPHNPDAAYQLNQMVGLKEVKLLVGRIIAAHKMKKVRHDLKMRESNLPLHMVFTGNPGSAKTTVARLLAGILKEEQVLSTGAFIECGRSDLVGKYVGWTAKIVRQKFQDASGGVLFIDEAYALVDGSNSFGAEAINTIVQEMENRRDDVLVIFAGYPNKMEEFINSNDGLKSRIAFHINFPDYKVDELEKILYVMAKERGFRLNRGILRKCRSYFQDAVKEENFGNGRYVRNLLDAAILHQSERLIAASQRHKITRQKAVCLTMEDFAPIKLPKVKSDHQIGFNLEFANETAPNE